MFDFKSIIENLLNTYVLAPVVKTAEPRGYLPDVQINEHLQNEMDKIHLEFLVKLFLASKESLTEKSLGWFVKEITRYLSYSYPNLSVREYELILQALINMPKE